MDEGTTKVKIMMRQRYLTTQVSYERYALPSRTEGGRGDRTPRHHKEIEEKTMNDMRHTEEVSYTGQPSRIVGMCGPDQGTNEPLLQSH